MEWKDALFLFKEQWFLSLDGVGPLRYGETKNEVEKKLGPVVQKSTVNQIQLPWFFRNELLSSWPVLVWKSSQSSDIQKRFADIPWMNNGASQEIHPHLVAIFHPSNQLAAVFFGQYDVSPAIGGKAVLGASPEDLLTAAQLSSENEFQSRSMLEEKFNLILPKCGLTVEEVNTPKQSLHWVLSYSQFFKSEILWEPKIVSTKAKKALNELLQGPELKEFQRDATLLKVLKKTDQDKSLVSLYEFPDEDEFYEKTCIAVIGEHSIWQQAESESSAELELIVQGPPETLEGAAVRTMACDSKEQKEWPLGNENGFVAEVFNLARKKFDLAIAQQIFVFLTTQSKRPKNKKGGWPEWLQYNDTPVCSQCRSSQNMELLYQIVSDSKWSLGDNASLYLFRCHEHPNICHVVTQSN